MMARRTSTITNAGWSLNQLVMVDILTKVVDKHECYQINCVQFRYWLDWETCLLLQTRLYRQAFRTMHV